ncbi:MAG: hypothetical protein RRA92_01995 [Gemmatimonadota bacterium]|nr:hypothetical protein [Gemmatimonadota bacterium]
MIELIVLGATGAGLWATFVRTREFVRNRLRFVDSAQRPSAPWVAGVGAALVAAPVFGLLLAWLPAVGGMTAVAFGLTVGAGVRSGQKHVRLLTRG